MTPALCISAPHRVASASHVNKLDRRAAWDQPMNQSKTQKHGNITSQDKMHTFLWSNNIFTQPSSCVIVSPMVEIEMISVYLLFTREKDVLKKPIRPL